MSLFRNLFFVAFFSLSTIYYLLSTSAAYAAEPPNPQPCKNAVPTKPEDLVDNYLTNAQGEALGQYLDEIEVTSQSGQLPSRTYPITIDFSQLQAIFGKSNSDYLEGDFQNGTHSQENIQNLSSQDFNEYLGPLYKTSPKLLTDKLKVNYIEKIVTDKHTLPEAANKYTDTEGQGGQKTIYDLVNEFGTPDLDKAKNNPDEWNNTWGKYWQKIPTSYSDFYQGEITFNYLIGGNVEGDTKINLVKKGKLCPLRGDASYKFVMPEFYRTTAITDQINRLLLPQSAQSYQKHNVIAEAKDDDQVADQKCPVTNPDYKNGVKDIVKQIIKISLKTISPIKIAFAASSDTFCLKPPKDAKQGQAPYCPLPKEEAQKPGVVCQNKTDANKLETDNPNVVCSFTFTLSGATYTADDVKVCSKDPAKRCVEVRIFPDIRIPYLAAIWNNTVYSDQSEGGTSNQLSGRPGIYSQFRPQGTINLKYDGMTRKKYETIRTGCINSGDITSESCKNNGILFQKLTEDEINQYAKECLDKAHEDPKASTECVSPYLYKLDNNAPGAPDAATSPKQRFIGATDCSKLFVRDVAFKPIALQKDLGVTTECNLTASISRPPGGPGDLPPGGTGPDCSGKWNNTTAIRENFGDTNCDFSDDALYRLLQTLVPSGPINRVGTVDWWFYKIVSCESPQGGILRNPNAFNPNSPDPNGAWGLYQIGSTPNSHDNGKLDWRQQTTNAIALLSERGIAYWECAR